MNSKMNKGGVGSEPWALLAVVAVAALFVAMVMKPLDRDDAMQETMAREVFGEY